MKEAIDRAGRALERSGFQNFSEQLREKQPATPDGERYLCEYHNNDMDDRGVPFPSEEWKLEIWCQACRYLSLRRQFHQGRLSVGGIKAYEEEHPWALQTLKDMNKALGVGK